LPRRYRVAGSPIVRWFVNSRRRGSPRLSVVDYRPATTVASPPDLPKLDAIASGMPAGTSAVTPAVAAAGGSAGGSGIPFSPPRLLADLVGKTVVLRSPLCAGGHGGGGGDAGGRGTRPGVATPAAVATGGTATRGHGRQGRPRCPARATRGAYLTRRAATRGPHGGPGSRGREGAACDGLPGATRRVQRVARGTVTRPRLAIFSWRT